MPLVVAKGAPSVQAVFDTVGMDPRFVGRSTPVDCHWTVSVVLRSAGPNKRTFAKSAAFAKKLATECADQKQVLPYVSTRNTARDMDVVRLALGEERLSYLGYSYGTYLGSVYLQMFPQQVDRIVLDSSIDPAAYGPSLFSVSEAAGKAALAHWADWTAKHNSTYKLGKTRKQVLANVDYIRKKADSGPIDVGPYSIDSSILPLLFWTSDDSIGAKEEQAEFTQVLLAAAKGASVSPTDSLTQLLEFVDSAEAAPLLMAQSAVLCGDKAANRNAATYLTSIEKHRKADPLFAPLLYNIGPCAYWPITPRESLPKIGNSHPVLMVNSTGDTQTPYAGAVRLHRSLKGSRLVTLKNAYRHGIYLNGASNCVDRAVTKYLAEGTLPRSDLSCLTDRTTAAPTGAGFMPSLPLLDPTGAPEVTRPAPSAARYTF
jgi:pimeloyl-ACP methyl ester carboxylesterase